VYCPCQSALVGLTTTQQKSIDFDHEIMENRKVVILTMK
jgi:hypothetical protein